MEIPTPEVAVEPVAEPAQEPTPEVAVEPVAEPAVEPTPEVVVEPTPEVAVEPAQEPTISTESNENQDTLDKLLLALIPDSSSNFCTLTPTEIVFMTNLVKDASGTIVLQIQQTLDTVLQDGSISLHDIPQLVLLITQIFQSNVSVKNVNVLNLIQYTLHVLLESNILPISPQSQTAAKTMIDTSLTLLNTSLEQEYYSIFSCCFRSMK